MADGEMIVRMLRIEWRTLEIVLEAIANTDVGGDT